MFSVVSETLRCVPIEYFMVTCTFVPNHRKPHINNCGTRLRLVLIRSSRHRPLHLPQSTHLVSDTLQKPARRDQVK